MLYIQKQGDMQILELVVARMSDTCPLLDGNLLEVLMYDNPGIVVTVLEQIVIGIETLVIEMVGGIIRIVVVMMTMDEDVVGHVIHVKALSVGVRNVNVERRSKRNAKRK